MTLKNLLYILALSLFVLFGNTSCSQSMSAQNMNLLKEKSDLSTNKLNLSEEEKVVKKYILEARSGKYDNLIKLVDFESEESSEVEQSDQESVKASPDFSNLDLNRKLTLEEIPKLIFTAQAFAGEFSKKKLSDDISLVKVKIFSDKVTKFSNELFFKLYKVKDGDWKITEVSFLDSSINLDKSINN